jgi:ABC-type transporter Mla MlaB component
MIVHPPQTHTEQTEGSRVEAYGRSGADAGAAGTRPGATDIDDPSGAVPAVELAGGHLHVCSRRGVTILALDGGLDDALAAEVAPAMEAAIRSAEAVVFDIDRVTLLDRSALSRLLDVLDVVAGQHERCVVAGRLSGRLVLDRWSVPTSFAVFNSVPDALQARTFVESGYGHGWSPAT